MTSFDARNLQNFPFPPQMTRADQAEVERRIISVLSGLGDYFPLAGSTSCDWKPNGMDARETQLLLDKGLLFREPDSPAVLSTGAGRHWPHGRGVFVFREGTKRPGGDREEHVARGRRGSTRRSISSSWWQLGGRGLARDA